VVAIGNRDVPTCPNRTAKRFGDEVFAGAFADVRALVCYAMKANSNQAVIKTLAVNLALRRSRRRTHRNPPRGVRGWEPVSHPR
jgi:hypothetical protein